MRDWEKHYQEGDLPWDHGEVAPPLLEVLADWPRDVWGGGPVLVPGCGRGHDAAVLGGAGFRVLGLDLAPTAAVAGRALYGGVDQLEFVAGDFMDPDLPGAHPVRAIWEHTCFCALPREHREAYVEAAARWLPAGGRLIGVFYLDPDAEQGPPFGVERREIHDLFGRHFRIVREQVPTRFYPSREGRELLVEMIRTL